LAAFGWVEALAGSSRAVLAATLLAGSPFLLHEVYFTWPKLLAAYLTLLALLAVTRDRGFLAGCALGLGYLAHPAALFAIPMALGLLLVRSPGGWHAPGVRRVFFQTTGILSGVALAVLCWRLANRGRIDQGAFVDYALMAYGRRAASFREWLGLRLDSLTHTLVPFTGLSGRPAPGVPEGGFPRLVFQIWLNLAFALGLTAVPAFLLALGHALRRLTSLFLLVLVAP